MWVFLVVGRGVFCEGCGSRLQSFFRNDMIVWSNILEEVYEVFWFVCSVCLRSVWVLSLGDRNGRKGGRCLICGRVRVVALVFLAHLKRSSWQFCEHYYYGCY